MSPKEIRNWNDSPNSILAFLTKTSHSDREFTLTVKVLKFSLLEQKGTYTWYLHCSFTVLGDLGTE